ncbi:MAG: hypothetical protein O3A00_21700 [Planctomycetota bacterium]|nr:hypothetical protein [Planctomycetota bacterium]
MSTTLEGPSQPATLRETSRSSISSHAWTAKPIPPDPPIDELFEPLEVESFRQEDGDAGRHITIILCSLFIYTAIIMSVVLWWTLRTIGE